VDGHRWRLGRFILEEGLPLQVVGVFSMGKKRGHVLPYRDALEQNGLVFLCRTLTPVQVGHSGRGWPRLKKVALVEGDWEVVQQVCKESRGYWLEIKARLISTAEYVRLKQDGRLVLDE
jgi:hypothetical protein